MIPQTFEYTAPKSIDEALSLLESGAKPLAGGQSLIPMMKLRLAAPEHLVDLGRIRDLSYIREQEGALRIGAMTTHYEVESSVAVRTKCPLLAQAAASIGDVQVRNLGTIGGSIAHADPAADYPAALQALEARIVIQGKKGERTVNAADFFVDAFTTSLEPGEIIREVIVPVEASGTGVHYQKLAQPASGFALVGIAVRMRRQGGKIAMARIGVTGLSNIGYRALDAEKAIEGTAGSPDDIKRAAALVTQGVDANSDIHASADYRKHLATVYAARAIEAALAQAS
jgi:carbon-monoxide dehydrogenase medium subunit